MLIDIYTLLIFVDLLNFSLRNLGLILIIVREWVEKK
ncbi:Uncharacterised protein [Bacteroides heparinolyticus]|uniref:Uncharacterized protein n=1 Tax=Prevotella heparinolytica TaxID=28113 RepID=A0A449I0Q1_9BACE|nr:Uncharacterised protein [Bacteroides heparinolyticus]